MSLKKFNIYGRGIANENERLVLEAEYDIDSKKDLVELNMKIKVRDLSSGDDEYHVKYSYSVNVSNDKELPFSVRKAALKEFMLNNVIIDE